MMSENKIKYYRVRGFTLLEAVIAMMLTSLLVLFALSAIRYFTFLFQDIQSREEVQSEIRMLQNVLNEDVRQCEKIKYGEELIFLKADEQTRYQFEDDEIIRIHGLSSDTFRMEYIYPQISLSEQIPGLVEEVTIQCANEEVMFPVNIIKKYPLGLKPEMNY